MQGNMKFGLSKGQICIFIIPIIICISLILASISIGAKLENENGSIVTTITEPLAGSRASTVQQGISQWDSEVLWSYESKTSGCTIGDLDSTREGAEAVVACSDGKVVLVYKTKTGVWEMQELWQGDGELITPVIGDFYPGHDGNELVVVGMAVGPEGEGAGQATIIYGSGDNWNSAIMYIAPDMLHGLAVGDLDATHEGNEVIVMSFGYDVEMLTHNGTGAGADEWTVTHMWHGEGKVRKGVIDDFDPKHQGNELVVVDKSGNCTMLNGSDTNWTATTLWTDPGTPGLARVAHGEVLSKYPGKEIIVGGDSSNVGIIWRSGDSWDGEVIFTDSDKIRGLAVGDVDPTLPGSEVLVFGYSQKVTMLSYTGSNWKSRTIFTDTGRAHDLAVGELDSDHNGLELIFVGYSNNLTMLGVSPWFYDVIFGDESKTSGVTIGDLDSTRKGNELVSISSDGRVVLIYQTSPGTWKYRELWQGQGELITPVIADFYAGHDGNELVVVGMAVGPEGEGAGQATMIYGSGDNWNSAVMYVAPDMLHGLAVGDLDPNHDGNEVIVMSFGYDVEMLTHNGSGAAADEWTVTHMWRGEGKVRKGVIDDIDPTHSGNELVVVDKSGNCTMLTGSGTSWKTNTLWTDPGTPGLARITVGDVDPAYPGKEIVVGGDSSNVGIIRRSGGAWVGKVIFTDTDKIRGLGIGDVDPTHAGNEILVFGYSQKVTMLTGTGNNWATEALFKDTGRAHDLAVGEFDSSHVGQELVIVGYSKNATMIMNSELSTQPDVSIYGYPTTLTANAGDTVEFTIGALSVGGFNEPVRFSLEELPASITSTFNPEVVIPDSTTTLKLSVPLSMDDSAVDFSVEATSGDLSHSIDLQLKVLGDNVAPEVKATIPTYNEIDVPTITPIVIKFTEPIDTDSISSNSVKVIEDDTGTEYNWDFQYLEDTNTLIITDINDAEGLPEAKLIKVTFGTSIKDVAGNNLEEKYQLQFITLRGDQPSTGTLEIKAVYPEQDDKGVPIDSPIIVEFSLPIDISTVTWDNIDITSDRGGKYTGRINYDTESETMTVLDLQETATSSMNLMDDCKVTVTLKTGIETAAGEPLSEAYSWSFETVAAKGDTDTEEEDSADFETERNMYMLAMFILIIIIILTLLFAFSKGKGKDKGPSKEEESETGRVSPPKKRQGKRKGAPGKPSSRKKSRK